MYSTYWRQRRIGFFLIFITFVLIMSCDLGNNTDDGVDRQEGEILLYVSTAGSDQNSGTTSSEPLLTIQAAVDKAASSAEIRVASGTYTRGAGLSETGGYGVRLVTMDGAILSGGWNDDLSAVTGTSILVLEQNTPDDTSTYTKMVLIYCDDFTDSTISGFTLQSGYATGEGAGIHLSGDNNVLSNIVVTDCYTLIPLFASSYGAGIYVEGDGNQLDVEVSECTAKHGAGIAVVGNENSIAGTVSANSASYSLGSDYGGGVYIDGNDNTISAEVSGNTATKGGGIYIESGSTGNILSGEVHENTAAYGGGVYIAGDNTEITGPVYDNIAEGASVFGDIGAVVKGGGVYLEGNGNTVAGDVYGNTCRFTSVTILSLAPRTYGGGVYIDGDNNEVSADVYENYARTDVVSFFAAGAATYGGGISVAGTGSVISGSVHDNETRILGGLPNAYGGGIHITGDSTTVTADVTGNLIESVDLVGNTYGSGVSIMGAANVTLSGIEITGNQNSGLLSDSYAVYLVSLVDDLITGLVIENCVIGGTGGYAIVEKGNADPDAEPSYADITGHTIQGNSFLVSTLDYLYSDFDGGTIAADSAGLSTLNTAENPAHDASVVSGNTLD